MPAVLVNEPVVAVLLIVAEVALNDGTNLHIDAPNEAVLDIVGAFLDHAPALVAICISEAFFVLNAVTFA